MEFHSNSLGTVWVDMLRRIVDEGNRVVDRTGDYRELTRISFTATSVHHDDIIVRANVPEDHIIEMRKVFLGGAPSRFGHDYASLIRNADHDQVRFVVDTLRAKRHSRKAVVVMGARPGTAWVPCINALHFTI
ncbi:MAG: hypothetical protein ACRDGA_00670, partial [Bacteroidota bacterium]